MVKEILFQIRRTETFSLGLSNTISRLVAGFISMLPHLNALRVHNAFLFAAGVLTVLAAYAYDFKTCAIYATLCGFAIGNGNLYE